MIPSSSSGRSISSGGQRPPSSLSSRPSSSLSAPRPSSRVSHGRPPSSLTVRPPSAGSTYRPHSRYSSRPPSRVARSRLVPQYQILISQVTGLKDDGEEGELLKNLSDHVAKQLDGTTINKAAASVDISVIDRVISGLVDFYVYHALTHRGFVVGMP